MTICPTCGTRLAANAARCLVCGHEFPKENKTQSVSYVGVVKTMNVSGKLGKINFREALDNTVLVTGDIGCLSITLHQGHLEVTIEEVMDTELTIYLPNTVKRG